MFKRFIVFLLTTVIIYGAFTQFNFCSVNVVKIINRPKKVESTEKIYVAIVDTGFDPQHPSYKDKISVKYRYSTDHSINVREIPEYKDGFFKLSHHGTHITGILCGEMGKRTDGSYAFEGVAPHVKPILIQLLPYSSATEIATALDYILSTPAKIVSISMSFGSPEQPMPYEISRALMKLAASGKLICISAGNNGQYLESSNYSNSLLNLAYQTNGRIILVGATENIFSCLSFFNNIFPSLTERLASFSNRPYSYNSSLYFISAPGVGIRSTITHPFLDTMLLSGTSMATPVVTGALACILTKYPNIDQARELLFANARKTYKNSKKLLGPEFGVGIVDLSNILK